MTNISKKKIFTISSKDDIIKRAGKSKSGQRKSDQSLRGKPGEQSMRLLVCFKTDFAFHYRLYNRILKK
jgi:hypothetical protein